MVGVLSPENCRNLLRCDLPLASLTHISQQATLNRGASRPSPIPRALYSVEGSHFPASQEAWCELRSQQEFCVVKFTNSRRKLKTDSHLIRATKHKPEAAQKGIACLKHCACSEGSRSLCRRRWTPSALRSGCGFNMSD